MPHLEDLTVTAQFCIPELKKDKCIEGPQILSRNLTAGQNSPRSFQLIPVSSSA